MKKIIPIFLCMLFAAAANAQISFTLTMAPCHSDGILTANFTGLTGPLTVNWYTSGTTGTTITHPGVTGTSDALTSYSGGPITIGVTDATSTTYYNSYAGAPPFSYAVSTTAAVCPALGTATASVTGGTSPYTYQWYSIPSMAIVATTNPASLPAGPYGVIITDAAGCIFGSQFNPDSANIYTIPPFAVPVSTTVANCTNGTATVGTLTGGTAPYSYSWSTGATSSGITGLVMGSYNVVVTDAVGCSATGYAYVSQAITISVPITPTPATCLVSDGAAIAFGSGGIPPYSYVWNTTATTQAVTGLAAGSYNVTATDVNGCFGRGYTTIIASTPITVTYASTPSLCTSATGTSTLTISGGTTPYTTSWFTTPPQTGVTATALAPGNYTFNVVDAVGCRRGGTTTVLPVNVITATHTATSAVCTTATGGLSVSPTGGTTPYTYSWSTGSTASSISGVTGGGYSVTITDAISCQITKYLSVPVSSPMTVGVSTTPASCIFTNDGIATATPSGGTSPYTYSWTSGGTTSSISSLLTGNYWVGVTDAIGCHAWNYTHVGYNPSATSCYCTISGTVYHDANNNCIQDVGEPGIQNIQILCSGRGYTYTDASGNYSFKVPSGSYIITEIIRSFYPLSTCQLNNIPVTVTAFSGCVQTVNFANAINPIHDIHVSTWNYNFAVPGNTYNQAVVITNEGTLTESAILAGYKPDGQLFAPTFTPSGIFTGAPYWYNTSSGFTTLTPGASQPFLSAYTVPTNIPLGTNVVFKDTAAYSAPMTNWLTDYTPWNNVKYYSTTVVSSYDPNFKEVSPKGTGSAGTIYATDTVLEYMVHFQNLGTYMAQNVVVVDTLDNNLDWTSLRPVYQSAKCKITVTQSGTYKIATFTFNNINLPAKMHEPIASNGMFTYTIKTMPGLPAGSTFRNSASIYFDYNEPVKTNTTLNTLGVPSAITTVTPAEFNSFTVYPNPASGTFHALINTENGGTADMSVTDVTGKVLMTQTLELQKGNQTTTTDVSKLAPGMYFVNFSEKGKTQTQKLVIMK